MDPVKYSPVTRDEQRADYELQQGEVNKVKIRAIQTSSTTSPTHHVASQILRRGEWDNLEPTLRGVMSKKMTPDQTKNITQLLSKYDVLFKACGYAGSTSIQHLEKQNVRNQLLEELDKLKGLNVEELDVLKSHLLAENEQRSKQEFDRLMNSGYGDNVFVRSQYHAYASAVESKNSSEIIEGALSLLNSIDLFDSKISKSEVFLIKESLIKSIKAQIPKEAVDRTFELAETQNLLNTKNEPSFDLIYGLLNKFTKKEFSSENTEFLYLARLHDSVLKNEQLTEYQSEKANKILNERNPGRNIDVGQLSEEQLYDIIKETYIDMDANNDRLLNLPDIIKHIFENDESFDEYIDSLYQFIETSKPLIRSETEKEILRDLKKEKGITDEKISDQDFITTYQEEFDRRVGEKFEINLKAKIEDADEKRSGLRDMRKMSNDQKMQSVADSINRLYKNDTVRRFHNQYSDESELTPELKNDLIRIKAALFLEQVNAGPEQLPPPPVNLPGPPPLPPPPNTPPPLPGPPPLPPPPNTPPPT